MFLLMLSLTIWLCSFFYNLQLLRCLPTVFQWNGSEGDSGWWPDVNKCFSRFTVIQLASLQQCSPTLGFPLEHCPAYFWYFPLVSHLIEMIGSSSSSSRSSGEAWWQGTRLNLEQETLNMQGRWLAACFVPRWRLMPSHLHDSFRQFWWRSSTQWSSVLTFTDRAELDRLLWAAHTGFYWQQCRTRSSFDF